MTRFIDPALVSLALASVGTRIVAIDFVTKSGEPRTYTGLLRASSRLVGNERGAAQGERMKNSGQVWFATTKMSQVDGKMVAKPRSVSFFLDKVTGIRSGNVQLTAG